MTTTVHTDHPSGRPWRKTDLVDLTSEHLALRPGQKVSVIVEDEHELNAIYLGAVSNGVDRPDRRIFAVDDETGDGWKLMMQPNIKQVIVRSDKSVIPSEERVLCAAIWIDKTGRFIHQPTRSGLVLCGHRHPDIIEQIKALLGESAWAELRLSQRYREGFLTSTKRFLGRNEARKVAQAAKQINVIGGDLYSEDLY